MEIDFTPPPITTLFAFSFIDVMTEVAPAVVVKMKYVLMAHKILVKMELTSIFGKNQKINTPISMFIMSLVLSQSTMSEGKQRSAERVNKYRSMIL